MDSTNAKSWAPDPHMSLSTPHSTQISLQNSNPQLRPSLTPRTMAFPTDDPPTNGADGVQGWEDVFAALPSGVSTMSSFYDCVPKGDPGGPPNTSSSYVPTEEEFLNYTAIPSYASGPTNDVYGARWPSAADVTCPRRFPDLAQRSPFNSVEDSFPPSVYQIQTPEISNIQTDRSSTFPGYLPFDPSASGTVQVKEEYPSPAADEPSSLSPSDGYGTEFKPSAGFTSANAEVKTPPRNGEDSAAEKEEPYAKLIFRALLHAPNHTMILRDIYTWFRQNTDKGKDPDTKGWQNSIRHNLSMNGAFKKVDQPFGDETKKGFMWRLDEDAVREGVKSTTRFRTKQGNKRNGRSHHPAPQRQASGAKGGQATKRNARLRRSGKLDRMDEVPSLNMTNPAYRYSYPHGLPQVDLPSQPSFAYDAHDLLFTTSTPPLTAPSPYYTPPSQPSPYHEDPGMVASRPQTSAAATDERTPPTPVSSVFGEHKFSPAALDGSAAASPIHEGINEGIHALEFKLKPGEPLFYDSPPSDTNSPVTPQSLDWQMDLASMVPSTFDPPLCHDDFNRWL
ncbi:hypothetical protein P152DRAFT_131005 [Eremomyces bilateralis CBS 781.70]|uniref:Fork-head domain-containing protein n=1 Tax=Eremomyces bilateralis CBS 781.70 TaxID=1392243 RepID=A0A6G1GFL3_9PEZI|nr:uncharacterized protein P152DRAFT_131005 [Eremomyces bilateralis CBS 781.70]KAF1816640.1 hypothetical protein P152DRAFT_131005 [Eremomyces bilateralis CBS 781.70]